MKSVITSGILPKFILSMAKGVALLVILAVVFQAVTPALAWQSETPPSEEPLLAPQMTDTGWALYQVDSYHNFFNLTDRTLRFDKNGRPHIVYGGKHLYYTFYDGTKWNLTIVDNSPGVGEYAALALDSNNRPRISYYDAANRSLKFAYFDGFSWTTQTVDTPALAAVDLSPERLHRMNPGKLDFQPMANPEGAVGLYTSIAIDNNNEVHITYYDTTYADPNDEPGALRYAHWNGVTWQFGEMIDARTPVGSYNSVAIAPNTQRPCVSYLWEKYDDLAYACREADGSWRRETIDAAGNQGAFTSLAFDSNSIAHVSYYDFGNDNLKYAKNKSTGWEVTTLDTDGDTGLYTSIAIHSDNRVYISYIDDGADDLMLVNSANWSSPQRIADVASQGRYTSVAVDKDGRVGIVYYLVENAQLIYKHWNGNGWDSTTLDVAGDVGISSSLDININGAPYVGYGNSSSQDLKYAYAFNTTWLKSNILAGGYQVGQFNSLKLDSYGRSIIAYYDTASGDLKLASWNGTVWELRTVDASTNDVGRYVSLALDTSNRAHISYYDATAGNLKYAYWNGSAWVIKDVAVDGDVGKYSSIALDSANRPYISYFDATNGDLRLAYLSPIDAWVSESVDSGGIVGQYTAIAIDDLNQKHISYYDVDNGNLKYAEQFGSSWQIDVVDSTGNTGLYTSLAVDTFGRAYISYYNASNGDLMYAAGYPASWSVETVAFAGIVGLYTSIGLYGGSPAISYYDYTNGELWVAMAYPLPLPPYSVNIPFIAKNH